MAASDVTQSERLLVWLLLVVKLGTLVAVFWYGIAAYRKWSKKSRRHQ